MKQGSPPSMASFARQGRAGTRSLQLLERIQARQAQADRRFKVLTGQRRESNPVFARRRTARLSLEEELRTVKWQPVLVPRIIEEQVARPLASKRPAWMQAAASIAAAALIVIGLNGPAQAQPKTVIVRGQEVTFMPAGYLNNVLVPQELTISADRNAIDIRILETGKVTSDTSSLVGFGDPSRKAVIAASSQYTFDSPGKYVDTIFVVRDGHDALKVVTADARKYEQSDFVTTQVIPLGRQLSNPSLASPDACRGVYVVADGALSIQWIDVENQTTQKRIMLKAIFDFEHKDGSQITDYVLRVSGGDVDHTVFVTARGLQNVYAFRIVDGKLTSGGPISLQAGLAALGVTELVQPKMLVGSGEKGEYFAVTGSNVSETLVYRMSEDRASGVYLGKISNARFAAATKQVPVELALVAK